MAQFRARTTSRHGAGFTTTIRNFSEEVKDHIEYSVKEGTRVTLRESQTPVAQGGPMPVLTGMLRGSLSIGLNALAPKVTIIRPGDAWENELNGFQAGQRINASWTAPYSEHQEYGAQGRVGRGFMRQAAQRWAGNVKRLWAGFKG